MDAKEIEEMMTWLRQQVAEQGLDVDFGNAPSYVSSVVISIPVSTQKIKGSIGKKVRILTHLEESWNKQAGRHNRRLLLVPSS